MQSFRRIFIQQSGILAAVRIFGLFCVFLLQILVARYLADTTEYGLYAWGQSLLFVVGGLCTVGIPVTTSRFIASFQATGQHAAARSIVRQALGYLAISSFICALLALSLVAIRSWGSISQAPLNETLLVLLFAPLLTYLTFYQHIAQARYWIAQAYFPLYVIRPVAMGLGIIFFWGFTSVTPSALLVLSVLVFSVALGLIPQAVLYHHKVNARFPKINTQTQEPVLENNQLLRSSLSVHIGKVAGLITVYSNVLLLAPISGTAAAGIFFAAERLTSLAAVPGEVSKAIASPRIAASYTNRDHRSLQSTVTQAALVSFLPTLIIAVALYFFGYSVLQLFGQDFEGAMPVLLILLTALLARSFVGIVDEILIMCGHHRMVTRVSVVTAGIHLLLLFLLLPRHGAIGAAVATATSTIFRSLVVYLAVKKKLSVDTTFWAAISQKSR